MVLPGGAVGFLPCVVVVVVAVGVGVRVPVVGAPVGAMVGELVRPGAVVVVVGTAVGAVLGGGTGVPVGTIVGGAEVGAVVLVDGGGVDEPSDGVLDCSDGSSPGVVEVGFGVSSAASTCVLPGWCLTAAGAGISGVSRRGPPSRLLPMRMR